MSLTEIIRTWRGQSVADPRPNKALDADQLEWLLHGYPAAERVVHAARFGVTHRFTLPAPVRSLPARDNHRSAHEMHVALRRSIAEGQRAGAYFVLDLDVARERLNLRYSPFGCVAKAGVDPSVEARVIHDLSFPSGASTNAWSNQQDLPPLTYEHVDGIARRIILLRERHPSLDIKLMKGDVKSAFRHVRVHESVSPWFAGVIPEAGVAVIDLALPFGWTGSPAHYGVFGGAVSFLVRRESPRSLNASDLDAESFFCFDWVDDHVLIEVDSGTRLPSCDVALRLAMTAVLGPRAINENKFTSWSTRLTALGLEWDTVNMTVSMPESKIDKAIGRVRCLLDKASTTRVALSQLLGSLRHVCSCIRPAKPFFQRLASLWHRTPRAAKVTIDQDVRLDLVWFDHIITHGRLRGVPLRMFYSLPDPSVHLYMDASNEGLCVLHPAAEQYIRIRFDEEEQCQIQSGQLSINVREQLSATLAVLCWGEQWRSSVPHELVHVRFWIDNSTAVSWCNKFSSRNSMAQELNRILGAAEAVWGIRVSAEHLAGGSNYLADLGSRAWSEPSLTTWHALTNSWTQVQVPTRYRKLYSANYSPFNSDPSLTRLDDSTAQRGTIGSFQLILFAIHHWSSVNSSGRVGSANAILAKLSHIKWYHRVYAGFAPELTTGHAVALTGMRRLTGSSRPRAPFTTSMLSWLCNNLDLHQPHQRLILGAALVGFFFLLRSSEFLGVKGGRHAYALEVRDVEVLTITNSPAKFAVDAQIVRITLRGSKNDQFGNITVRQLKRSGHPRVCPVFGAMLLLQHAEATRLQPTDPLCSLSPSKPLKAEDLSKVIKAAASGVGADPSVYSCHSLRSGGATALLAAGADSTTIKLHGRWLSSAFQRYTRYTTSIGDHLASMMSGNRDENEGFSKENIDGVRANNLTRRRFLNP